MREVLIVEAGARLSKTDVLMILSRNESCTITECMHGIVLQNQGVIMVSVIIENKKAVQYYHVSSFFIFPATFG